MAINHIQLATYVIKPTLEETGLFSDSAINLLLGTCAQESHMGTYLHQLGNGPAIGIFQMEPTTFNDIFENYLIYKTELCKIIRAALKCKNLNVLKPIDMTWNLKLATIMCRIHYLRVPKKLPEANDLAGLANYWKKYYNTKLGKGTTDEFIINYRRFIDV